MPIQPQRFRWIMCQKRFGGTFLDPQYESFFSIVNQFFGGLKISEYWKRWIKHCWWFPEKKYFYLFGIPYRSMKWSNCWQNQRCSTQKDVSKICKGSKDEAYSPRPQVLFLACWPSLQRNQTWVSYSKQVLEIFRTTPKHPNQLWFILAPQNLQ